MPISSELAALIDQTRRASENSNLLKSVAAVNVADAKGIMSGVASYPRHTRFHLLAIAEHLVAAHQWAKADGDGSTIDVIQDALLCVGKRLAKETEASGPAARRILGHHRE